MILLRKMTDAEFPAFREIAINEYGEDLASNYGHSLERGKTIAAKGMAKDLPKGVSTPNHFLRCIDLIEGDSCNQVGYLWYLINNEENTVFISDFYIYDQYRSKGYGKAALSAMEKEAVGKGIEFIKLRVATDNKRALKLYQAMGFSITGINMAKKI